MKMLHGYVSENSVLSRLSMGPDYLGGLQARIHALLCLLTKSVDQENN